MDYNRIVKLVDVGQEQVQIIVDWSMILLAGKF